MKQTSMDDIDDVLDDFGRHPGVAKRMMYGLLGAMVSCVPTMLCVNIFVVDTSKAQLTLGVGVLLSAILLSMSYHNLAFSQSARLRSVSSAPSKNSFKNSRETREIGAYDKAVRAYENNISSACFAYSFAYNNAIFLLAAPFAASYVFADKVSGELNALCSAVCAGALALFNSKSALKAIGE